MKIGVLTFHSCINYGSYWQAGCLVEGLSARLVESFAWQLGAPIEDVRAVEYRRKDPGRPANWYTAHLTLANGSARWQDWWHLADGDWGAAFFQNNACKS